MSDVNERAWRCTVCGYIHRGPEPPDFCPICGAAAEEFEPYVEPEMPVHAVRGNRWRCLNCFYIHEGDDPPGFCPICGVPSDRFEQVDEQEIPQQSGEGLRMVVIGGGIAGVSAAESMARSAPEATIIILNEEDAPPYYRLNLTRYLAGETKDDVLPIHEKSWYADNGITLRVGTSVQALFPEENRIVLGDDEDMHYDRLVLAMGSHAFVPPIPGADLNGVHTLRTARNANSIISDLRSTEACVVVGGGLLGIETAAAMARRGHTVFQIESHEWVMPRQLNRKAARYLEGHLERLGIVLKKGVRTKRILGEQSVSGIVLSSGEKIDTSLVILATGVRPNSYLARKAGLDVNYGVMVDNNLQTSQPNILAAGDLAEHNGRLYGAWAPSQYQGTIAGLNAAGIPTSFGGLPRANTLKVLDLDLVSVGQFEPMDGSYLVFDHEEDSRFAHFVFRDGRMVGTVLMDFPDIGQAVKMAIEKGEDFSSLLRIAQRGMDVIDHMAGG